MTKKNEEQTEGKPEGEKKKKRGERQYTPEELEKMRFSRGFVFSMVTHLYIIGRLVRDLIGSQSNDAEVRLKHLAEKSKLSPKILTAELSEMPPEDLVSKGTSVFYRDRTGAPAMRNYQFKGFLKESSGILLERLEGRLAAKDSNQMVRFEVGGEYAKRAMSVYTHKGILDNEVHVHPYFIAVSGGLGPELTRPLRCETMQGPRVALATSETIPAGGVFGVHLSVHRPELVEWILCCLDSGIDKGLGQWRNSSAGTFVWELSTREVVYGMNAAANEGIELPDSGQDSRDGQ